MQRLACSDYNSDQGTDSITIQSIYHSYHAHSPQWLHANQFVMVTIHFSTVTMSFIKIIHAELDMNFTYCFPSLRHILLTALKDILNLIVFIHREGKILCEDGALLSIYLMVLCFSILPCKVVWLHCRNGGFIMLLKWLVYIRSVNKIVFRVIFEVSSRSPHLN